MTAAAPTPYQLAILAAMQTKPMYGGTVPHTERRRRRNANRRARASRRTNRR